MELQKKKFDYKWVILVLGILMNMICLGFCSSNKGMYLTAITQALGIKRSLFSFNDTFRFMTSAIVNIFFGSLVYRFGVRKMVAVGFAAVLGAMVMYATADNVIGFYAGGILLGVGLAFTTTTMIGSIVRRWFTKDVGRYTGIVFASNGIGAVVSTQLLSPIVNGADPFGYRTAYWIITAVVVVVGIVTVALLREAPENVETVDKTFAKKKRSPMWSGIDLNTARKKPYFYVAAVAVLVTGICLQSINGVYMAHLQDAGRTAEFAANISSLFFVFLVTTKILVGAMYDKFGLKMVMLVCPLCGVVAFVMLALVDTSPLGLVLALGYAIFDSIAIPLETLVVPLIVNDLFGSVSYEKMLGIFSAINYTGYALGSPLINLTYDVSGSYEYALIVCAGIMLLGCVTFRFVLKDVVKVRQQQDSRRLEEIKE